MDSYLFFDNETTGFLKGDNPANAGQPHIVQLAAALTDGLGNIQQVISYIVKPNGYEIPKQAADVHGVPTHRAEKFGVPLNHVLQAFDNLVAVSDVIVCHNVKYDLTVAKAAYHKQGLQETSQYTHLTEKETYCTMSAKEVIDWCAIPPTAKMKNAGRFHYKTPNLGELYKLCTGEELDGAHNAMIDVKATIKAFFHLKKLGIITT